MNGSLVGVQSLEELLLNLVPPPLLSELFSLLPYPSLMLRLFPLLSLNDLLSLASPRCEDSPDPCLIFALLLVAPFGI